MPYEHRPAWMEIDIKALKHNYKVLDRHFKGTKVCAVVKADAYGHGMVPIAKALAEEGVDFFAVATVLEAIELRRALPKSDILILGYTPTEATETLLDFDLIQTLYDKEQAFGFHEIAAQTNRRLRVHVKIDTGMRRLGFKPIPETIVVLEALNALKGIEIDGIFSHFAKADEMDTTSVHQQGRQFLEVLDMMSERGLKFRLRHMCNSASAVRFPEYHFDMVRPGIALYGLPPSEEINLEELGLKEVMCVKAELAMVKRVAKGDGVSYGHRYYLPKEMNIATVPLGYGDGLMRALSGKGKVLIQGVPKTIVGSVCMDQCLVAIDDLEAKRGDCVIVMGGNAHPDVSIMAYARALNTISYEVTCLFSNRLHRKIIE